MIYGDGEFQISGPDTSGGQWRQRLGNCGGWIDAKGKVKVSWGMEVTQWGPGAKTQ